MGSGVRGVRGVPTRLGRLRAGRLSRSESSARRSALAARCASESGALAPCSGSRVCEQPACCCCQGGKTPARHTSGPELTAKS